MRAKVWMMPQELNVFQKTGKITLVSTPTESVEVTRINGTDNATVVSSTCPEFSVGMEVKVEVMHERDLTARAIKEDQFAYKAEVELRKRNSRPFVAASVEVPAFVSNN